jgi:hypothetical protein
VGETAGGTPPGEPGSQPPSRPSWSGWGWGSGWGGYPRRGGGLWFGVVLIVLGLYFLGLNLGWFSGLRWDIFWPVAIIVLGVLILLRRVR